jgi:hypothetical protein
MMSFSHPDGALSTHDVWEESVEDVGGMERLPE